MTVSIQDVTFTYPGAQTPVLRNLSLEVPQGAFLALIGTNGSGKTSLCKLLTGIVPQFFEGDFSGTVLVNGLNTLEHRVSELARSVGYVYQDFENQLLKPRVLEDVSFAPLNFGLPDYRDRAEAALNMLGLSHLAPRIVWELSGGEQHLTALAGALALNPDIIVVDEPVSQLDPVNAEAVYSRLNMLHKQFGKTIIVIEHHPDFIANYCDSVALLKEGGVAWHLPVREALARVEDLQENNILAPQVTRIARHMTDRYGLQLSDTPIRLQEGLAAFKPYAERRKASVDTGHKLAIEPVNSFDETASAEFKGIRHDYELMEGERKDVLTDIELKLFAGQRIALVGANGSGKSTLMKMLAGLERPKQGQVMIRGRDIVKDSPEKLADEIALVYQDPQEMFIEDSISGDIAYFLKERKIPGWEKILEQALADFNLTELRERDGRLLSGGQMRRASLAIGACMRPRIMLLDEPTSNLDVANRAQIVRMLALLQDQVDLVMIATHDMELVAEWATRVIVMNAGQVIADVSPGEIFADAELIERARIYPPQVVWLSNALEISPVQLSVESMAEYLSAG
jgi:energy-coupling factor transporter ATP-binding protein EcfA2